MSAFHYKILKYAVTAIACLIFANQLYRHHVYDLSTWKGGGMGMFAAWDRPSRARFVRIYADTDRYQRIPIQIAGGVLSTRAYEVQTEPSESNLEALAKVLSSRQWFYQDGDQILQARDNSGQLITIGHAPTLGRIGSEQAKLAKITIQYGEIRYDIAQRTLAPFIAKERSYDF